ncbi:MAG: site-specific tyrosine recombinase/integron integrase [bacterium]|nr:tyrosine-type recombinase/integrase [Patescibacteria group bacterium]
MIDQFVDYMELEKNYSPGTIHQYGCDLKLFKGFLKIKDILGVESGDIRGFLAHLKRERKYSPTTIARKQATLRAFYKFCRKEKKVSDNPMEFIDTPKLPERQPVYLTDEERKNIFDMVNSLTYTIRGKRDYAIISLLYYAGLRVSELVGLNAGDMRREGDSVTLKIIGKGNKERKVPLRIEAQEAINTWLQNRPSTAESNSAIFINTKTKKRLTARTVQFLIKRITEQADIKKKITPHKFRHTFGTRLLQQGANLVDIQVLLGHASLNTTRIYTHTNPARLEEAVSKL